MARTQNKSKVLIPLILAFVSLILIVISGWLISQYYSEQVYKVLEGHTVNSEKMLIITKLIETTHYRTRLTGQMLVTEDIFERDEIALQLDSHATEFYLLRRELLSQSLNWREQQIMESQSKLIREVLPRQRRAAELALSDLKKDIEEARDILYNEVIPGQVSLNDHFMEMLNLLRDEVQKTSLDSVIKHKLASGVNLSLIFAFTIITVFISIATIKRILSIENNLGKVNKELTRLNNVKTDFVSLVSHELRTPLTSIKSFSEILKDDIEEMDVATQKRYLSIIDSESDRLARLVSNILDIQKIDANKMEWNDEEVSLNDVVENAVDTFSAAYINKGLELNVAVVNETLTVVADADKVKQVLANLLSNALKFTDEGEVLVTIYRFKNKNSYDGTRDVARVCVSDTGLGIPEDELLKVFESFHQVDNSATRKKGGSGLGLDICRKIINHYQGEIWVDSEIGKGSSFYFELPLVKATKKKIGDTLIDLGMITDDQLRLALEEQNKSEGSASDHE